MNFRHSRLAAAASLMAVVMVGTVTAADASTVAREHGFATQARAAGLTSSQAQELQDRIDTRLAELGGVQTAANEISLPNGSELLLPLPGEVRARDLDAPRQTKNVQAPDSCAFHTFCAYYREHFMGEVLRQKLCDELLTIPGSWSGPGSWSNNQSTGTVARMYDDRDMLVYTTRGAYSEDRTGNWSSIYWVDACN
ncbi:peptidase inhibitor family I36 protein [Streptomyces decoyicus]